MTVEGGLNEPEELEPEQGSLDLADPADTWTVADWEAQAAAVLRKSKRLRDEDADSQVWQKLTRKTLDGIEVTPLGTQALVSDLSTSGRPTRQGDWDIRAKLDARDAKLANEDALVDLDGGVTSLWLTGETDYAVALKDVLLDLAPVVLDGGDADAFLSYAEGRELHPDTNLGIPAEDATVEAARTAQARGIRAFVVDASAIHDKGSSDAQELAWSMESGVRCLRVLTDGGLSVDEAAGLVEFRYAATDEQFPTIAKLRAARRLWARVLEMSEATGREMRLHAVTSRPMMSKYDPWVNMLRTTIAAFAAGVGGADSVTVLPFDGPLGRPDAFGRRIARNTNHLLIDEAHVAQVADPAGARTPSSGSPTTSRSSPGTSSARSTTVPRTSTPRSPRRSPSASARSRRAGGRSPASPSSRTSTRPCPPARASRTRSAATARASRRCATSPPPPPSTWPRSAPSRSTPPARRSRPTCSPPAASRSRPSPAGSSASPAPTRRTTSRAPRPRPRRVATAPSG